ncbi:MAG: hypothetical protein AAGF76_03230 [Pseudomonadota bacterium]
MSGVAQAREVGAAALWRSIALCLFLPWVLSGCLGTGAGSARIEVAPDVATARATAAAETEAEEARAAEAGDTSETAEDETATAEAAPEDGVENADDPTDAVPAPGQPEDIAYGVTRPVEDTLLVAPVTRRTGATWLATGKSLLSEGRAEAAEAAFRRSLTSEAVTVEALTGAGIAANAQGHLAQAKAFLMRARALAPTDVDVNNALGTVLARQGDARGAHAAFRTAFVVSSGTSEIAALGLAETEARARQQADPGQLGAPEGSVAFDLSRMGRSEFLLHDLGSVPKNEPIEAILVEDNGAESVDETIAALETAPAEIEETPEGALADEPTAEDLVTTQPVDEEEAPVETGPAILTAPEADPANPAAETGPGGGIIASVEAVAPRAGSSVDPSEAAARAAARAAEREEDGVLRASTAARPAPAADDAAARRAEAQRRAAALLSGVGGGSRLGALEPKQGNLPSEAEAIDATARGGTAASGRESAAEAGSTLAPAPGERDD